MKTSPDLQPTAQRLVQRWQRAQMLVRCALRPGEPALIRLYLHAGAQLVRRQALAAAPTHRQMLRTLLHAAQDDALPWSWRAACLEHVNLPLARLTSLLREADPVALQAMLAEVEGVRDALPVGPGSHKPPR